MKTEQRRIQIDVSSENEGTDSPWWFIVSPRSGFLSNPEAIASCITGPFFSREEAEEQLTRRRYDYSKKAIVWCASGYHSGQYKTALREHEGLRR